MPVYELGALVPLSAIVQDANGTLVDVTGNFTFTALHADGLTTSGALIGIHDGSGRYHYDYPAPKVGRWTYAGTGMTAAGPVLFSDSFEVDTLSSRQIMSVSDALVALRLDKSPNAQSYVADLRDTITGITAVIESIVGPVIPVTVDEWLDGGSPYVMLTRRPVLSVTLVTESYGGGTTFTLIEQDPSDTDLGTYGYSLKASTGKLTRRVSGIAACFAGGRENIHAVYQAGRITTPPNIRNAAMELLRVNYIPTQTGNLTSWGRLATDDVDPSAAIRMGFFVPNRVMEQLSPDNNRVWAG